MSDWLKIAIAVGAALLIGLLIGVLLGMSGKSELRAAAEAAQARASAADKRAKAAAAELEAGQDKVARRWALLRSKEQLLRAFLQLKSSNFGIAGQHLSAASVQLKKARAKAGALLQPKLDAIRKEIAAAHTLTMGLDPVAQVQVERIIDQVHALPGAR